MQTPTLGASRRRGSSPRLVIAVTALALGVAVLVLSVVGFGRTVKALTAFAARTNISAERSSRMSRMSEPASTAASAVAVLAPSLQREETSGPSPVPQPTDSVAAGGASAGLVRAAAEIAGSGGLGGTAGVSGASGSAGTAGVGGLGGAGGGTAQAGVACGQVECRPDQRCCNASCGICTAPGENCTQQLCGVANMASSVMCGPSTCNVGQVCCNESCGICAAPGASCSQRTCSGPRVPTAVMCGAAQCNDGQVCCNASCGICVAPGQSCSHDICR
jgi:hypothetical protein